MQHLTLGYIWRETPVISQLGLPVYSKLGAKLPSPPWKRQLCCWQAVVMNVFVKCSKWRLSDWSCVKCIFSKIIVSINFKILLLCKRRDYEIYKFITLNDIYRTQNQNAKLKYILRLPNPPKIFLHTNWMNIESRSEGISHPPVWMISWTCWFRWSTDSRRVERWPS